MASERMTIGALARRCGVPVKTLRYYSDEGLLLPVERTSGGYRVYAEEAVPALDLIRTLREAGLAIAEIKAIVGRELSLGDALRLRLAAVEAHIDSLKQVAAALRVSLRGEPDEVDMQRLCTVTRLSGEERKAVIEGFHARVADGVPVDEQWKRNIMAANVPRLPDNATPAQLDAWIELAEMVQDEAFVAAMQASAAESWGPNFDVAAHQQASTQATTAARALLDRGVAPDADEAVPVIERWISGLAAAMGTPIDAEFRAATRERFTRQDPRLGRYWALFATLTAPEAPSWPDAEWKWLVAAIDHHLAPR